MHLFVLHIKRAKEIKEITDKQDVIGENDKSDEHNGDKILVPNKNKFEIFFFKISLKQ